MKYGKALENVLTSLRCPKWGEIRVGIKHKSTQNDR